MSEISKRIGNMSIQQLEVYLQNKQWTQDGKIRSIATVWHRLDSEDAEVVLPLSPTVKDYGQRLKDALSAVASYEQRPVVEIINEVVRFFANVITVRVIHVDTQDGTIPINDGVLLISKAKELLSSAAMSIYMRRKQFTGIPSKDARAYVESLLLGQTEVGSYVVNVIAPVQGNAAVQAQTVDKMPLAEAVTLNLVTGLEALKQASKAYKEHHDLRVFEAAVQQGASANMCDALLGFSGAERNRSFEIKITASPGPLLTSEPRVFEFDAVHVEALTKASDYYKDDYVLENRTLTGFVRKLSRPKGENFGTITIQAIVDDMDRNVQIELSGDDYHTAVLAHDKQSFVQCSGNVHVKNKSTRLINPHDLRVIAVDDLF
jgi:hypothetical protein